MAATPFPASLGKPSMPVLQRGHPLAQGLVGAWLFTEGGAATANAAGQRYSIRDWSDNRLTGLSTPAGGGTLAMQWGGGLFGTAFVTGAAVGVAESRIDITDPRFAAVINTTEFSFAGWVRDDSTSTTQFEYILTCPSYDGTTEPFCLRINTGGGGPLSVSTTSTAFTPYNSVFVFDAAAPLWFHFVVSCSLKRGTIITSINGKFDSSAAVTTGFSFTNTNPFCIGGSGPNINTRPWVGAIDSILMWNRGLNADDVRLLYSDHYAMFRVPSFAPVFRLPPPPPLPLMGQIWLA